MESADPPTKHLKNFLRSI